MDFHKLALAAMIGSYVSVIIAILAANIAVAILTGPGFEAIGQFLQPLFNGIKLAAATAKTTTRFGKIVTSIMNFVKGVEKVIDGISNLIEGLKTYLMQFEFFKFLSAVSDLVSNIANSALFKILTGDLGEAVVDGLGISFVKNSTFFAKLASHADDLKKLQNLIEASSLVADSVEGISKIGGKVDDIADIGRATNRAMDATSSAKIVNNMVDTSVDKQKAVDKLKEFTEYIRENVAKGKVPDIKGYFNKIPASEMNDFTKADVLRQFDEIWRYPQNRSQFGINQLTNPKITKEIDYDSLSFLGKLENQNENILRLQNLGKADIKPMTEFVSDAKRMKNQFSTMSFEQRKSFLEFFNNNLAKLDINSPEQIESLRKVISNFDDPILFRIVGDEKTVQIMTKAQDNIFNISKNLPVNEELAKLFNNNPQLLELAKKNSTPTRTMLLKTKFANGEDIVKLLNGNEELTEAFCDLLKNDHFLDGTKAAKLNKEEVIKLIDRLKYNPYFQDILIKDMGKLEQFKNLMQIDDVTMSQIKLKALTSMSQNGKEHVSHLLKYISKDDVIAFKSLNTVEDVVSRETLFKNIKNLLEANGNQTILNGTQLRFIYEGEDITKVIDEMFNIKKANLEDQISKADNLNDLKIIDIEDDYVEVTYKEKKLGTINQNNLNDLEIKGLSQNEQANLFDEFSNTTLQNRVKSKQQQLTDGLNAELLKTDPNDTQRISAIQNAYQEKLNKCQSILNELETIKNAPPSQKVFVNKTNPLPKLNTTLDELDNFKFNSSNKFTQDNIDNIVDSEKGIN